MKRAMAIGKAVKIAASVDGSFNLGKHAPAMFDHAADIWQSILDRRYTLPNDALEASLQAHYASLCGDEPVGRFQGLAWFTFMLQSWAFRARIETPPAPAVKPQPVQMDQGLERGFDDEPDRDPRLFQKRKPAKT